MCRDGRIKGTCHEGRCQRGGNSLDSPVDPQFGRARFLVLVDTQTGEHTGHSNEEERGATQAPESKRCRSRPAWERKPC